MIPNPMGTTPIVVVSMWENTCAMKWAGVNVCIPAFKGVLANALNIPVTMKGPNKR
jgi:hypothetical protein